MIIYLAKFGDILNTKGENLEHTFTFLAIVAIFLWIFLLFFNFQNLVPEPRVFFLFFFLFFLKWPSSIKSN